MENIPIHLRKVEDYFGRRVGRLILKIKMKTFGNKWRRSMCGMEPLKGLTHSLHVVEKELGWNLCCQVFKKVWKMLEIDVFKPKVRANARTMCFKEDNFVWVNLKVWVQSY